MRCLNILSWAVWLIVLAAFIPLSHWLFRPALWRPFRYANISLWPPVFCNNYSTRALCISAALLKRFASWKHFLCACVRAWKPTFIKALLSVIGGGQGSWKLQPHQLFCAGRQVALVVICVWIINYPSFDTAFAKSVCRIEQLWICQAMMFVGLPISNWKLCNSLVFNIKASFTVCFKRNFKIATFNNAIWHSF